MNYHHLCKLIDGTLPGRDIWLQSSSDPVLERSRGPAGDGREARLLEKIGEEEAYAERHYGKSPAYHGGYLAALAWVRAEIEAGRKSSRDKAHDR